MVCPIELGTVGNNPYVIMTKVSTQNEVSIAYKLAGLSVEVLKLECEKLNLTSIYFHRR